MPTIVEDIGAERRAIEHVYGKDNVWSTEEAREQFAFNSFAAPFVIVTRKKDGVRGTLEFQHMPRFYFDFLPE